MRILVTGSTGHLGEGLVRTLRGQGRAVAGIDIKPSAFTTHVGSITDAALVADAIAGADAVIHTATLHKPHVATHTRQDFVDTNISGTLTLLEAAVRAGVKAFVFTSSTSVFGDAMVPPPGGPAVWIDESVVPVPKNIYGVTKHAAEDLCQMFTRNLGLPTVVLRTSRFFPEDDDNRARRDAFDQDNLKVNELLFRRVDIADAVDAHLLAVAAAPRLGHARYVVSAPSPFTRDDLAGLHDDAPKVVARHVPEFPAIYETRGWQMLPSVDRVYSCAAAMRDLGWTPRNDFRAALARLAEGRDYRSDLAIAVGSKGYHDEVFEDGPFPVED